MPAGKVSAASSAAVAKRRFMFLILSDRVEVVPGTVGVGQGRAETSLTEVP